MAGPSAGSSSKPFAKPTARSSARATGAAASSVVTGKTVKTRFGDVQVRITVRARRIVAVREVKHTHAGTLSTKINKRALPVLYRETVQRQSARIDAVSGATVTSTGYLKSLQSAIDLAHLA
jgi:uncharacterized protein with FMN-binding domain